MNDPIVNIKEEPYTYLNRGSSIPELSLPTSSVIAPMYSIIPIRVHNPETEKSECDSMYTIKCDSMYTIKCEAYETCLIHPVVSTCWLCLRATTNLNGADERWSGVLYEAAFLCILTCHQRKPYSPKLTNWNDHSQRIDEQPINQRVAMWQISLFDTADWAPFQIFEMLCLIRHTALMVPHTTCNRMYYYTQDLDVSQHK